MAAAVGAAVVATGRVVEHGQLLGPRSNSDDDFAVAAVVAEPGAAADVAVAEGQQTVAAEVPRTSDIERR